MANVTTGVPGAPVESEDVPEEYPLPPIVALTPDESWALYDELARKELGMSAEEFERAWQAGEFAGREEEDGVLWVWMLRTTRPE
jgi:hypothetical protein